MFFRSYGRRPSLPTDMNHIQQHPRTMTSVDFRAFVVAASAAMAMFCTMAPALSATVDSGQRIATEGSPGGAPACTACHGAAGQGEAAAGFPRLAGMNAKYLVRQLAAFADGTRVNAVMGPVAKLLVSGERESVATYYAGLSPQAEAPVQTDANGPLQGATLAEHGDWGHALPACAQCHGPGGLGVGDNFPALAGQPSAYLANQLHAWKLGTRKDDPMALMQGIAQKLSDAQIAATAGYYAALPVGAAPAPKGKP